MAQGRAQSSVETQSSLFIKVWAQEFLAIAFGETGSACGHFFSLQPCPGKGISVGMCVDAWPGRHAAS